MTILLFSHIPKAAGTTVRRGFLPLLDEERVVNLKIGDNGEGKEALTGFARRQVPPDTKFVAGHLPAGAFVANESLRRRDDVILLSFVRDPIERAISIYNFRHVTRHDHPHRKVPVDLVEASSMGSRQATFLGVPVEHRPSWRVVIAPVDDLVAVCAEIAREIAPDRDGIGPFTRHNVTAEQPNPNGVRLLGRDDVTPAIRNAMEHHLREDTALYDAVRAAGRLDRLPDANPRRYAYVVREYGLAS